MKAIEHSNYFTTSLPNYFQEIENNRKRLCSQHPSHNIKSWAQIEWHEEKQSRKHQVFILLQRV